MVKIMKLDGQRKCPERDCFELCIKRRPKRGLNLFTNNLHVAKVNYYSEQEIHAEICYADCTLMLLALESILNGKEQLDQTICNYSVKLKACFNAYKSCYEILQRRTFYQNENSRNEFKLGVFFGLGIINLISKNLPVSIQQSMKFDIDLSFDYDTALEDASTQINIREMLAIIFQLVYKIDRLETYGEETNFDTCERLIRYALERYNESCILHYLDGKVKQIQGHHAAAISKFEICLASTSLIRSLQYHCEYNMAICFAIEQHWLKAADSALYLVNSSQTIYSPILTRYMYAVFLQMHFFFINYDLYDSWRYLTDSNLVVNNRDHIEFKLTRPDGNEQTSRDGSNCSSRADRSESSSLTNSYSTSRTNSMTDSINMIHNSWKKLNDLPYDTVNNNKTKNQRLLDERLEQMTERQFNEELRNQFDSILKFKYPKGKQLDSIEVLCFINANKFLTTGRLVLPAIELFYWMNLFSYLKGRKDLVNSIIKLIDIELVEEDELKDEPKADMDNFALLYLLKGVCLSTNQEFDQAIKCFKEILYCDSRIKRDKHILHFSLLQLPLVLIKNSKHLEALYYLDKERELCRDDLNKMFGQVTSIPSLNVQKIFTTKVMQLEQALSEINDGQEIERRKLGKKRNSIATIQLNSAPSIRRSSTTNHLRQLFRQRTLGNILYKDELLEANLAKKCNQNRRNSLSDFIKNSIFGS